MTNGAMEKAFEEWRRTQECYCRECTELTGRGFAAGYHARDAMVAELQTRNHRLFVREADLENTVAELQQRAAAFSALQNIMIDEVLKKAFPPTTPPQSLPPDDDPLTMPVERLRECVAREVMGWQLCTSVCGYWNSKTNRHIIDRDEFRPDTNPADWQMVKDKMREREWDYSISYQADMPSRCSLPPCFVFFSRRVPTYLECKANAGSEGVAVCRAALRAVRA